MNLQGALVELLLARGHADAVQADVRARAVDTDGVLEAGAARADGSVDRGDERVATATGVIHLEGLRAGTPALDGEAGDFGTGAGMNVAGRDGQGAGVGRGTEVVVLNRDRGVFAGDNQGVWEDGCAIGRGPVDGYKRLANLDALGDEEDVASPEPRLVQGEELRTTETGRVLQEVFLEESRVVTHRIR